MNTSRTPMPTLVALAALVAATAGGAVAVSGGAGFEITESVIAAGGGRSDNDCGNCTEELGVTGCSDPDCEALICSIDAFCCATLWDDLCVDAAVANCGCGGTTELTGTIGQPDAAPQLTSASFELSGGFFAGAGPGITPCDGDTNGDATVNIDDIVNVVLDFGCTAPPACPNGGDVNGDDVVNIDDIVFVVLNFGNACS